MAKVFTRLKPAPKKLVSFVIYLILIVAYLGIQGHSKENFSVSQFAVFVLCIFFLQLVEANILELPEKVEIFDLPALCKPPTRQFFDVHSHIYNRQSILGVILFVFTLFLARQLLAASQEIQTLSLLVWIAFRAAIEEIVFRGILFRNLIPFMKKITGRHILGTICLTLISALIFACLHIVNYKNSNEPVAYALIAFLSGIVFCQLFLITRSLIFPFLLHTVMNFLIYLSEDEANYLKGDTFLRVLSAEAVLISLLAIMAFWPRDEDSKHSPDLPA